MRKVVLTIVGDGNMKMKHGEVFVCTESASNAYKKGGQYRAFENKDGVVCLMGGDGLEDFGSLLVSKFAPVKETKLKVVT